MRQVLVRIPTNEIVVDSLAADVTDLLALVDVDGSCLVGPRVLDRIRCAVVWMQFNCILAESPLGIETHIVVGHLIKGIRITRAESIVIPAKEHVTIELRRDFVFGSVDICLVVDVALCCEIGTCRRSVSHRIAATVNKDAVAVRNIPLVALIADIDIVIGCAAISLGGVWDFTVIPYGRPLAARVIKPVRINRKTGIRLSRIPSSRVAEWCRCN